MTDDAIKTEADLSTTSAPRAAKIPAGFLPLLIALSGLGPMSMQAIMPALPALASYFQQDISIAQLAISLYLVGLACAQLVVGPLSVMDDGR
jgi:DHA1 family bicyclomycin/chloramphenicol resistance-like MFS transporter